MIFRLIASEEPDVLIYNMASKTLEGRIPTHDVGVRYLALNKDNSLLAILDMNGSIKIHALETSLNFLQIPSLSSKATLSHHTSLVSKECVRSTCAVGCSLVWYDNGNYSSLIVPSTKGSIIVLEPKNHKNGSSEWSEKFLLGDSLKNIQHEKVDINLCTLSKDGHFLISVDVSGIMLLWKLNGNSLAQSVPLRRLTVSLNTPLFDVSWKANNDAKSIHLMLLTAQGYRTYSLQLTSEEAALLLQSTASVVVQEKQKDISDDDFLFAASQFDDSPVKTNAPEATKIATPLSADKPKSKKLQKAKKEVNFADDDDDDLLANDFSPQAKEKKSAPSVKHLFKDEAEEDDDDLVDDDEGSKKDMDDFLTTDYGEDAMIMEDDDIGGLDGGKGGSNAKVEELLSLSKSLRQQAQNQTKIQSSFQPSSTRIDDKSRRYLVWNQVGNITLREDPLENRVEIRFTNTATNKNETFPDRLGFVMGTLGEDGAAFASPPEDVDPNKEVLHRKGSVLLYHAFSGAHHLQGINETFRVTLGDGESIQALAVGKGFVAAATDKKLLRIFSSTGIELSVTWLRGPVVCMVALNNLLAVVYNAQLPLQETPQLALDFYEFDWLAGCRGSLLLSNLPVPLSNKATLEWIGFDCDNNLLTILDSQGMMSALLRCNGWQWMPILNIPEVRKSIDHKYWPIMIKNNKLVYVLLNGESKPAVYPQPVVSVKTFRAPLVHELNSKAINDQQKEKSTQWLWDEARTNHLEQTIQEKTQKLNGMMSEEIQELTMKLDEQLLETDKLVLKALQEACQSQQIPLALNLALKIRTTKVLEAGIKVANHFGRSAVAALLDGLLQQRQMIEQLQAQMAAGAMEDAPMNNGIAMSSQGYHMDADDYYQHAEEQEELEALEPSTQQLPPSYPHGRGEKRSLPEDETVSNNSLSKKVSLKSKTSMVTPDVRANAVSQGSAEERANKVLNMFAVNKTGETPVKRRIESLSDLKVSPSPKKASLNVSFSLFLFLLNLCSNINFFLFFLENKYFLTKCSYATIK